MHSKLQLMVGNQRKFPHLFHSWIRNEATCSTINRTCILVGFDLVATRRTHIVGSKHTLLIMNESYQNNVHAQLSQLVRSIDSESGGKPGRFGREVAHSKRSKESLSHALPSSTEWLLCWCAQALAALAKMRMPSDREKETKTAVGWETSTKGSARFAWLTHWKKVKSVQSLMNDRTFLILID